MRRYVSRSMLVGLVGWCALPAAAQYDKEFAEGPNNNFWGNAENWSPAGVPDGSDAVLIPEGETCVIHNGGSDAVAELVDVEGLLTIEQSRTLTFTEDSVVTGTLTVNGGGTLDMDGELTLYGENSSGSGGTLVVSRSGGASTISGDGAILVEAGSVDPGHLYGVGVVNVEVDNDGKVEAFGSESDVLIFNAAIDGSGEWWATYGTHLIVAGGATGDGTFRTAGSGSGATNLNLFIFRTVEVCFNADFEVPRGTISAETDLCTTGDVTVGDDGVGESKGAIHVHAGKTATFKVDDLANCGCS